MINEASAEWKKYFPQFSVHHRPHRSSISSMTTHWLVGIEARAMMKILEMVFFLWLMMNWVEFQLHRRCVWCCHGKINLLQLNVCHLSLLTAICHSICVCWVKESSTWYRSHRKYLACFSEDYTAEHTRQSSTLSSSDNNKFSIRVEILAIFLGCSLAGTLECIAWMWGKVETFTFSTKNFYLIRADFFLHSISNCI